MPYIEPTPEEYQAFLRIQRENAAKGARKRWSSMSPEARKEVGKMLAEARKSKREKKKIDNVATT